jgi:hypothetical protein
MPTNLKVSVDLVKTYPVILGYNALTQEQKELVHDQGWYESDFPNPRQERFWEVDGVVFSEEMDLIRLGALAFGGWQYQYYCQDESFLARFSKDLNTIEVAKVTVSL